MINPTMGSVCRFVNIVPPQAIAPAIEGCLFRPHMGMVLVVLDEVVDSEHMRRDARDEWRRATSGETLNDASARARLRAIADVLQRHNRPVGDVARRFRLPLKVCDEARTDRSTPAILPADRSIAMERFIRASGIEGVRVGIETAIFGPGIDLAIVVLHDAFGSLPDRASSPFRGRVLGMLDAFRDATGPEERHARLSDLRHLIKKSASPWDAAIRRYFRKRDRSERETFVRADERVAS